MPAISSRLFFYFLFFIFSLNVFAESSTPEELQKVSTLCESISSSDPKILASKTPDEIREAKVYLVEVAIETKELRPSCFRLLSEDIISELGFSDKLSLLFLGELSSRIYIFIGIIMLFLVMLLIGFFYFYGPDRSDETLGKKSKKYGPGKIDLQSGVDEYTSLLEFFSLDETASESEIKKAYREMARTHHPDTSESTTREEFELIQTNYDKLMKLRKGWFGLAR
jgi:hypothetical protein